MMSGCCLSLRLGAGSPAGDREAHCPLGGCLAVLMLPIVEIAEPQGDRGCGPLRSALGCVVATASPAKFWYGCLPASGAQCRLTLACKGQLMLVQLAEACLHGRPAAPCLLTLQLRLLDSAFAWTPGGTVARSPALASSAPLDPVGSTTPCACSKSVSFHDDRCTAGHLAFHRSSLTSRDRRQPTKAHETKRKAHALQRRGGRVLHTMASGSDRCRRPVGLQPVGGCLRSTPCGSRKPAGGLTLCVTTPCQ